ncbi:MAG: aspartate ammonia-lyase, partial [Ignavibacteriae bacterium]
MIKNYFIFFFLIILTTNVFAQEDYRTEKDLIGEKKISNDLYYGVQTARAVENFQISLTKVADYRDFIKALGMVKLAAARANHELGAIDDAVMDAVEKACKDVIEGKFDDQFDIDMYQGGAGTSTNMAANEIIANVALEYMNKP